MSLKPILLTTMFYTALLAGCATQQPQPQVQAASVQAEPRPVEYPWMSRERWYRMHAEDVGIAAQGDADLILLGDSITEGWPEELVQQYFGDYQPANFGIGGDRTENVLWRLRNGSVGQLEPEVVTLLIGVNNFNLRDDTPDDVVQGIRAVVEELRGAFPDADVVLHAVFPYKESAQSPERDNIKQVNARIASLADDPRVHFLDVGPQLVQDNGDIAPEIMPDFLHLSEQGYQIWAQALAPVVNQLMSD